MPPRGGGVHPTAYALRMDFSPAGIFAGLVVSAFGTGLAIYGRKQRRLPQLLGGILLLVEPLFVAGWWQILGIGTVLVALVWLALRMGL